MCDRYLNNTDCSISLQILLVPNVIQSNWILVSMIKENWETDVTSARLKGTEKLVWFLQMLQNWIWISPWHKKPWHQKGGSQLDSKLSGGPWALKMESGTECTVCAILKMSSDNSSFESGVGILWLMCTWAFQVLYYSRAWQTSVATWPGVRDIWMKITKDLHWSALMLDLSPQMPNLISKW